VIPFAGFDVNAQAARRALTRTVRGFLAAMLARSQTRFVVRLPTVNFGIGTLDLGTLTVTVDDGDIAALRPVGAIHHGVEADFDVTGTVSITGASLSISVLGVNLNPPLPTLAATMTIPFVGVDLDVDVTPQGIPIQLVLGLKHVHLRPIALSKVQPAVITPVLQFILNAVSALLSAGLSVATTLVDRIPVPVKPLVDAFAVLGLQFRSSGPAALDSPFITAVGSAPDEVLVVAADFERVNPPPAGDPNQLAPMVTAGQDVAATLDQAVINQGVDLAMGHGFIPSVFPGGGFKFHVKWVEVALLGPAAAAAHAGRNGFPATRFAHPTTGAPLGAIQVGAELRAKRGSCWCKVKVKIIVDAMVWPYLTVPSPPVPAPPQPGQPVAAQRDVHLRMFFDAAATVNVSGYLIVLIDLLFGPILVPLLLLLSQVANLTLRQLLPYTRTITTGAGTSLTLTASSATVAAYLTWKLDFNVAAVVDGQGDMVLDPFTHFALVDAATLAGLPVPVQDKVDLKVDYADDSIVIEDGVIRLGANLER